MIGFPLALLYANAGEWLLHRYLLHGPGKRKGSFWSFHFHEHHRASRRHDMFDDSYERPPLGLHAQGKETLGIALLVGVHLPLGLVAPGFTAGVVWSAVSYYRRHKRAHLDPGWARLHLPWHYDHHMGPDQDANWCVSRPWFDHLMGTRKPYVGTPREAEDRARRRRRRPTPASPRGRGSWGETPPLAA